jgi:branched-chain amino acid transport system permease protein
MIPVSEILDTTVGDRLPGIQGVVYGAALMAMMLFAPEGLYWRVRNSVLRRSRDAAGSIRSVLVLPAAPSAARAAPSPSATALMDVRGVSKAFLGLQALSDVSFDVREGEILGIIGPNGAGKTTLFNVLNGFLLPDRGDIRWLGASITGLQPHVVCRRGIGRTFQVMRVFPHLSVLENVMVGAFAHGAAPARARASARAALEQVGLADRADVMPTGLTTLELRLMEFARCLATSPRLILLDEPLAGLSTDGVELMSAMIRRAPTANITVVIIEHTIHALIKLADRLVVLDQGRRLAEGLPGDVTRTPAVIEAYLGKRWLARQASTQQPGRPC